MKRSFCLFCLLTLATVQGGALQAQEMTNRAEYALKAQILVLITSYMKWPVARSGKPFVISVVGQSKFGDLLASYAAKHTAKGRPIEIQHWVWPKKEGDCDMVFISASEEGRAEQILAWCAGKGILTTCESPRLAREGAMVGLVLEGTRVRIHVNRSAMATEGFSADAQLLALSRLVGPEPRGQ